MEPSWMKPVASRTVCDFFYLLFWAYLFAAVLIVGLMLFTLSTAKKAGIELYTDLFMQAIVLSIVVVDAMFTYILCERALEFK
jgi:uncharacterized SAM-binding protein YcdF (DUF218 family)